MNLIEPSDTKLTPRTLCALIPGLSIETATKLDAHSTLQHLPANRLLWEAEASPGYLGFVLSGYLRLQSHGVDGQRHILSVFRKGDLVGEPPGRRSTYPLETCTETVLCRVDPRGFEHLLAASPDLRRTVYLLCLAKRDQTRWLIWALGMLSAEERLCAFLSNALSDMPFDRRADGTGVLTVDLPRRDMADLLRTSVESISRITNRMHDAGVLRILNARQFDILDPARLARMGCQRPRMVPQRPTGTPPWAAGPARGDRGADGRTPA